MRHCFAFCLALFCAAASAQSFANPRLLPLGFDPATVVAGDLNGDGRPDILYGTGLTADGTVTPLLAQADGTYVAAANVSLPAQIGPLCRLTDVNRDAKLDMICAGYPSTHASIAVFLGNGDGSFQSPILVQLASTSHNTVPVVAAARDLNNDGNPDLIVTDGGNSTVMSLLGDGTGHFNQAGVLQVSEVPAVAALEDLNGDGKLDLVESGIGNGVGIYAGHGDGTFSLTADYPLFNAAVLADVDGDGHVDLVSGGNGKVTILHGNSDGTFNAAPIVSIDYVAGPDPRSGNASYLAIFAFLDVNGDGIGDLVAEGDDGLTVMLGEPGLKFGAPAHYPVAQDFWNALFNLSVTERFGLALPRTANQLIDLNGDGHPDFVSTAPGGISIVYGNADGSFQSIPAYESGDVVGYATVADFNNDGIPDVLNTGDQVLHLRLGKGDGTFQAATDISAAGISFQASAIFELSAHVLHGDFNGDGNQDILLYGCAPSPPYLWYLLLGHGDGTFDAPVATTIEAPQFAQSAPETIRVVDINKDGKDDLASLDGDGTVLNAYLSGPGNTFSEFDTHLIDNYIYSVSLPVFLDVNGDGRLDIVYNDGMHAYVALGNGDGTFRTPAALPIPAIPGAALEQTGPMASGDFDGDGIQDFAALIYWDTAAQLLSNVDNIAPTELFVWYGQPDGTFSSPVAVPTSSHTFLHLDSADVNQDGRSDLIFNNGNNFYSPVGPVIGIMFGLADRAFSAESDTIAGNGLSSLYVGDLNHDGFPDMLAANGDFNATANSFTVLLNQGKSSVVRGVLTASPEPSRIGQAITLTASLTPASPATLSGSVSFSIDGVAVGSANLSGNKATVPISVALAVGQHTLSATWAGNASYPSITLKGTHVVVPIGTSVLVVSSGNPSVAGAPITFTATVASTIAGAAPLSGSVVWNSGGSTLSSSSVSAAGSLSATAIYTTTSLPVGTSLITASYSGDDEFAASSGSVNQVITALPVTASFTAGPNPALVGQGVTLSFSVSNSMAGFPLPTGSVTFQDGGTSLGKTELVSGVAVFPATFMVTGNHALSAVYSGDASHASASASTTELINSLATPDFTLSASPPALTIQAGDHTTFTVTASSVGLYTGTLDFSNGSLPEYVTMTATPNRVQLSPGGQSTVSFTLDTESVPAYLSLQQDQRRRDQLWSVAFVCPICLLFLGRVRTGREFSRLLGAAFAAVLLLSMVGCGFSYYLADLSFASPGSYALKITALDAKQGVGHTVSIPLKITAQ